MAFDNALGADYKGSFQDTGVSDNDFVTAMASNGFQDFLGKSLSRTDLGHMFNTEQHVGQCPSTINPTDLQRDNFHVDPIEEEVLRRLRVDASSSPNNLRAIESQPRRELQPDGQSNPVADPTVKRSRPRGSRRRIHEDEWLNKKQIIEDLLLHENRTLQEMMTIMEDEHQFIASETAYKTHLKQWEIKKNLPKGLATYLWSKAKQRKDEKGVGTKYWYRGAQVPVDKYKRVGSGRSEATLVRLKRSILSNLTIVTTSTSSRDGSSEPQGQKRRRLEDSGDEHSDMQAMPAPRNRKSVEIHQRTSRFPKPCDFDVANYQQDPMSIEQRLNGHSFQHTALSDELGLMPLPELSNLADRLINQGLHASNDMVLEALLTKLEDPDEAEADNPKKTLMYTVSWLRNMVFQRKFLAAKKILEGICSKDGFGSLPPNYRLEISKLAVLVDVHENLHEPRDLANVEARCIALLVEQNATEYKPDRYWPDNLILAYLFRLYGIHDRDLQQGTVNRMSEVFRTQFRTKAPSISLVWTAQQYIRWSLRRMDFENAGSTLKRLKDVVGKNMPECDQNAMLETIHNKMRPRENEAAAAPPIVDIYEHNKVDEQWLRYFSGYLWDEPYPYMEDPRMKSRKEHDTGYLH